VNEATVRANLTRQLRFELRGAVVFRHEDFRSGGIPDTSVTWKGLTIWLEIKYANPRIISRGNQKETAKRLAKTSHCWFVVYEEIKGERRTVIVHPDEIGDLSKVPDERVKPGSFDHEFVVNFVRKIHDNDRTLRISSSTHD
jgi:hypothetical protein